MDTVKSDAMFLCVLCKGTFIKGRSDEVARSEAQKAFTQEELEETVEVCEDCWLRMRDAAPEFDARYRGTDIQ
jgi:hypothetical protein